MVRLLSDLESLRSFIPEFGRSLPSLIIMGRQCLICGSKDLQLHRYFPQWKEALVAHCDEAALDRLNDEELASGTKTAKICASHFVELPRGTRLTAKLGLEYLKTEYCGPARLPKPESDSSWRARHSTSEKSTPSQPSELISHNEEPLRSSKTTSSVSSKRSQGSSSQSSGGIAKKNLERFTKALEAAIETIEPDCKDDKDDLLRKYLIGCEIGRDIIVGAVLSVGEDYLAHTTMFAPRRPIAKALLRSLNSLNVVVEPREIRFGTGMSRRIIADCSQELKEVRFTNSDLASTADSDRFWP